MALRGHCFSVEESMTKDEQLANQSEAVCEADGVSDEVVENCEVAK